MTEPTATAAGCLVRHRSWTIAGLLVVASIGLVSVLRLVDVEAFMRMALGRVAASDLEPARDPFLFTVDRGLANTQWLGDILLYACYSAGGEHALVVLRILAVVAGSLLLLRAVHVNGAGLAPATVLVCAVVLITGLRWNERNEMHLAWLVPAYVCLLQPKREPLRWLLLPLGLVWANVHGSFPVGWAILFAGLCDAWLAGNRRAVIQLTVIGLVHPVLPLLSPAGFDVYRVLWEHQQHSDWLAQNLGEWLPPSARPATLREGALHVLVVVTLATFLARENRRAVARFVFAVVGVVFVYKAIRFAPLSAMLLAIACGGNLARIEIPRRVAWFFGGAVIASALYLGWTGRTDSVARPHPLAETAGAVGAARWLGDHASPGSRVFHPFNQSQLLMWFAPQVKLAVGAHAPWFAFAEWKAASSSSVAFDSFVERFHVDYVLTYAQAASTAPAFRQYLEGHPRWHVVYRDRYGAVFAREPSR